MSLTAKTRQFISTSSEWNFELIAAYDRAIGDIARDKYQLETYPNQITKLMDLLVAFEKKNCVPSNMSASLYDRLADKFDNITINKWPC